MISTAWRLLQAKTWMLALLLSIVLVSVYAIALPAALSPESINGTLGTLAPLAILAMANTPAFLVGGGGIDLSLAPVMGLSNALLAAYLLPSPIWGTPVVAIPLLVALGACVGAVNGLIVARLRYPPVIATLCTYFVLTGVDQIILPEPVATRPNWTDDVTGAVGPVPGAIVAIGVPLLVWVGIRRTALYENLMSVGDRDSAAFSAGVDVVAVRIIAYAIGGALAAVAGIALTGMVRSADTALYDSYVLIGLASLALGGTNLAGGKGGLLGSALGALCLFSLGNTLVALNLPGVAVQSAYGALLLIAIVAGRRVRSGVGTT